MITADAVKRSVLDPAMEGIALNRAQERLIYNASPELDSIAEWVNAMAEQDPERCAETMRLLTQLVATNQLEQTEWFKTAGFGDETIRLLRRAERQPGGGLAWTRRRLVDHVRGPLAVIADPAGHDAMAFVRAVRLLDDLIETVSANDLLAPAVLYQLGERKAETLQQLVESHNDSGAQAGNPGAAGHEGDSPSDQAAV